jgi:uncharacterized RDD family membrane protein YckC
MFCSKCGNPLAAGTAFCQTCGTPVPAAAPAAAISAPAIPGSPAFAGAVGQVGVSPHWLPVPTRTYAGFWLRFLALVIDSFILGAISSALFIPLAAMTGLGAALRGIHPDREPDPAVFVALLSYLPLLIGLGVLGKWLYYAYCESSEWQATPGKKVLNLVVTDLNGNRISFGRASGRFFAKYISAMTMLIGYVMAGFTEKRQALHDMIASCLVLRS